MTRRSCSRSRRARRPCLTRRLSNSPRGVPSPTVRTSAGGYGSDRKGRRSGNPLTTRISTISPERAAEDPCPSELLNSRSGNASSPPFARPELIHQHEGIGPVRLEPVPTVEIGERRIVGEARPVACRRIRVRPFEAHEIELELRQHGSDPRQREALLLDVEHEVAAAAHAVKILALRDPREERVVLPREDRR